MIIEKDLKIWDEGKVPYFNEEFDQPQLYIKTYFFGDVDKDRPCVVIYPGGGYVNKAVIHEGRMIAEMLNDNNINAAVVYYRTHPYKYPVPILDGYRALRYFKSVASDFGIDSSKIGVLGFSAGGHLAATISVKYSHDDYLPKETDMIDEIDVKPAFSILCYPVISSQPGYISGHSFDTLLGDRFEDKELLYSLSVENYVTPDCSPAFIWSTAKDKPEMIENAILMAKSYWKNGVKCSLHVFESGGHGLGLSDGRYKPHMNVKSVSQWADLVVHFIKDNTGYTK